LVSLYVLVQLLLGIINSSFDLVVLYYFRINLITSLLELVRKFIVFFKTPWISRLEMSLGETISEFSV